jgi:hypothetical protein
MNDVIELPDSTSLGAIGQPLRRKEDERLLTGRGRFSDDFTLPGQSYAAVVRSPHPHARISCVGVAHYGEGSVFRSMLGLGRTSGYPIGMRCRSVWKALERGNDARRIWEGQNDTLV